MMNRFETIKHAALGLAVSVSTLAFAPGAQASTVTLEYEGSGVYGTPSWARSVTYELDGVEHSHNAGLFRLQDSATGQSILAWCIDLAQSIRNNTDYDTMVSVATGAQMLNIDRLFTSGYASVNDSDSAAGFQLALWEIMTDTGSASGLDLTDGDFTTSGTSARYTAAADFLTNIGTATGGYDLTTYFSSTRQDLVSATAVPLPAAAVLMLSGIAGMGVVGRRRRRS